MSVKLIVRETSNVDGAYVRARGMGRAASQFVCPKVLTRKQRGAIAVPRVAQRTTYLAGAK